MRAYSDADYAGDRETRRSRTGTVLTVNGGPVVWTSSRQKSVSLSTCESEFIASCLASTQIIWTSRLLSEVGVSSIEPTVLYVDNQSAIRVIKNPACHKPMKHVDVALKFVREKYQEGKLNIQYIKSSEQLADLFTKALTNPTFSNLCIMLNIVTFQ